MDDVKAAYSINACQNATGVTLDLFITLEEVDHCLFTMCRYKMINEKREVLVQPTAQARLPTEYGEFQVHTYKASDGLEHAALVAVTHHFWPFISFLLVQLQSFSLIQPQSDDSFLAVKGCALVSLCKISC